MNGRQRDDAVREYLEAKLHQRFDRRDFLRLSSGLVVATASSAFLAACATGGGSTATAGAATAAPSAAPTAAATAAATAGPTAAPSVAASMAAATLEWIGLDGEDAAKVESAKKWRDEHGITLASKYIGTGDEILAALNAGQQFDIAITFNPYIERSAQAKLLQPLDFSRLTNWTDMFDGLKNAKFLNVDGKPYGAPIAWGDGPVVYNPKKVPTEQVPKSIVDLYDKKWAKRLTMSNDPAWLFYTTAISMGMTKAPALTKDELAKVADRATDLVKQNVVSFAATYADAVDLLVRGEVDLSLLGWEAMLNFAKDKGGELAFDFLKEGKGGWSDSYCIPSGAVDIDAAYAYIDAIISPQINADVAVNLVSGTVNKKGVALIPQKDNIYDYKNVESAQDGVFDNYLAPESVTDPNMATRADWTAAWGKITA
jgi:putative spermidine/putrescine transport system substrate-binding protein